MIFVFWICSLVVCVFTTNVEIWRHGPFGLGWLFSFQPFPPTKKSYLLDMNKKPHCILAFSATFWLFFSQVYLRYKGSQLYSGTIWRWSHATFSYINYCAIILSFPGHSFVTHRRGISRNGIYFPLIRNFSWVLNKRLNHSSQRCILPVFFPVDLLPWQ